MVSHFTDNHTASAKKKQCSIIDLRLCLDIMDDRVNLRLKVQDNILLGWTITDYF